jgi:hypothetical protein
MSPAVLPPAGSARMQRLADATWQYPGQRGTAAPGRDGSSGAAVTGCLTDQRNSRTNGTQLRLEACTVTAAQRWRLS